MKREQIIKPSKAHGLNPSVIMCPLCGKDSGVAFFGYIEGDQKAPDKVAGDPCHQCTEHMKRGFIIVEAEKSDEGIKLLGGFWVITYEAAQKLIVSEEALKMRCCYMDRETCTQLGLHNLPITE